jgi:hypothetical protein
MENLGASRTDAWEFMVYGSWFIVYGKIHCAQSESRPSSLMGAEAFAINHKRQTINY